MNIVLNSIVTILVFCYQNGIANVLVLEEQTKPRSSQVQHKFMVCVRQKKESLPILAKFTFQLVFARLQEKQRDWEIIQLTRNELSIKVSLFAGKYNNKKFTKSIIKGIFLFLTFGSNKQQKHPYIHQSPKYIKNSCTTQWCFQNHVKHLRSSALQKQL